MNALLQLVYLGNFISFAILFSFTWLLLSFLSKKLLKQPIILAIPLSFIVYIIIISSPLPSPLQNNLKQMLLQQDVNKIESNGFLNSILIPCIQNKGFIRGNDYRHAVEWFNKDMSNHKGVFYLERKNNLNLNTNLSLCEFTTKFNTIKHREIQ